MDFIVSSIRFLFLLFNFMATGFAVPLIIHNQQGNGVSSRYSSILNNLTYIDSLPFDGITINLPQRATLLQPGNVASYSDIYDWLGPLKGQLKKVTHNYSYIDARPCADPFDDWTQTIANWVTMAEASRDSGLEGIFFDNEEYFELMWQYPSSCKYGSTQTLASYQAQYRLRGQQVMSAILAQWPGCKIVVLHVACASDSNTPNQYLTQEGPLGPSWLAGFFTAGLFSSAPGQVIDGGEEYLFRTASDFQGSATWRKTTEPTFNPPLIPSSLASTWQSKYSISFGLFDEPWQSGTMSPAIFQSDMTLGLTYADTRVWTYAEGYDWLTPGGVPSTYVTAVWNARSAAGLPAPGASPTPTPTPTPTPKSTPTPVVPLVSSVQVSSITSTTATVSWNVSPASTGQVKYGPTSAYGSFTTLETNHLTFHSQNLMALQAGTVYHYQIIGIDSSGGSVPPVDRIFTTQVAVSNVQASVSRTSATISWNVSPDSTGQVEYGTTTAYGGFTTLETNDLSFHRQNVNGLHPGTNYHYRLHGTDVAGATVAPVDRTFTTIY